MKIFSKSRSIDVRKGKKYLYEIMLIISVTINKRWNGPHAESSEGAVEQNALFF
jgi:hypothetical protein